MKPDPLTGVGRFAKQPDGSCVAVLPADYFFDFDSAALRPTSRPGLTTLIADLARTSGPIDVTGHTDGIGGASYNQALSERRAEAVVDWLVTHGTAATRLSASGLGQAGARPGVADASSRRVDVVVVRCPA